MTKPDDIVHSISGSDAFYPKYGLTKREYFAAMAMQGILANSTFTDNARYMAREKGITLTDEALELIDPFCKLAADCADALIDALNQKK